jgi:hypothetical protein
MARERMDTEVRNNVTELDFGFDGMHKQKVLKGVNAYARLLDRLIRKRKGTNPSDPEMGIDLDKYRFSELDNLTTSLPDIIRTQASKYLPMIHISEIDSHVEKVRGQHVLYIKVKLLFTEEEILLGYVQQNKSIITTKIEVTNPKFINTKGSDY